jgi:hypothetical protein
MEEIESATLHTFGRGQHWGGRGQYVKSYSAIKPTLTKEGTGFAVLASAAISLAAKVREDRRKSVNPSVVYWPGAATRRG